ncbi:DUF6816 family protein [Gloeocapsa sp. PCC 7428]|uniref:DUF6816 family protein n=1 Tax=Gloeocapsa sp. PCC 7428 TaxID=1173026 RepID=UPI0012DE2F96|nr:hypothetical protein [Gloeocapsa sp. PCC 7428]
MRVFWGLCLVIALFLSGNEAVAGQLADRLASFPHWNKLVVQVAQGDLVYPDWMAGSWNVTSTLIDAVAPLAPEIVTPGFESNRQNLQQPIRFPVRFEEKKLFQSQAFAPTTVRSAVVADRAFNGLSLAKAYLGDVAIALKVDPQSPNRQITLLKGDRQLVSIVSGRATETLGENQFITTEVFQQFFRSKDSRPYFNEVESTTAYHYLPQSEPTIIADQVTAVYLSPQDPDYFAAASRPVALYRYRLEFSRVDPPKTRKPAVETAAT